MYLKRLVLHNFKNIVDGDLTFSPKLNCICGDNGEGKTNLLDAVYYLSMTRSYFQPNDRFSFTHGCDESSINGRYEAADGTQEQISLSMKKTGEKSVRRNKKAYKKFSEHIGLIPIVMVSPADSSLINDSGEERRRFMNTLLSQTDRVYMKHLQDYGQLLMQRNKLLKGEMPMEELLETMAMQMSPHADYIYRKRKELTASLQPLVEEFYKFLSDGKETISLKYRSDLDRGSFEELVAADSARESALGFTCVGVQRDDISFDIDGYNIKKCGSQGQQKTFLLALKIAQFHLMREIYGSAPLLLLDDVFDKLDNSRVACLIKMVTSEEFGQIFITDCEPSRLRSVTANFASDCALFSVKNGVFGRME